MLCIPLAALALAATTIAASGCGGSSKAGAPSAAASTTTTAEVAPPPPPTGQIKLASGRPLTRADWIAKGEAICKRAKIKSTAISSSSTAEYVRTLPQLAIYARIEAQELSKLVAPRSMAHDWARIVYGFARDSDYLDTVALYVRDKANKAAAVPYEKAISLYKELKQVAGRDGFIECAHARVEGSS